MQNDAVLTFSGAYSAFQIITRYTRGIYDGGSASNGVQFNASDSNPIYGNYNTVVPAHVNTLWCIKF